MEMSAGNTAADASGPARCTTTEQGLTEHLTSPGARCDQPSHGPQDPLGPRSPGRLGRPHQHRRGRVPRHRLRATASAPVADEPADLYSLADMPELDVIEGAAKEFNRAADQARRADRGKRAARKILDRLPAGLYGAWSVERIPSGRQTADLDEIRAMYKRLGLGPVPMKTSAPTLKVKRVQVDAAPALVDAELSALAGVR
jgi:hypothetical protein